MVERLEVKDYDVCIYHSKCCDGFCAAWLVHRENPKIEFHSWNHSRTRPDDVLELLEIVNDKRVLIVDFSFKRDIMDQLMTEAAELRVVDHHETAKNELAGLNYATFDMNRSGAGLLFDLMYPGKERFPLVSYVEDRDLWNWEIEYSREVNAAIQLSDFDFDAYSSLNNGISSNIEKVIAAGKLILDIQNKTIQGMISNSKEVDLFVAPNSKDTVSAIAIPCSVSTLISLTGEAILKDVERTKGEIQLAVIYTVFPDGNAVFSLRSTKDYAVDDIAVAYGGGGHPNSCGFKYNVVENGYPWSLSY